MEIFRGYGRSSGRRQRRLCGLLAVLSLGASLGSGSAHAMGGQVFAFGDNGSGRACFGTGIVGNPTATGIDEMNLGGRNIVQVEAAGGAFSGHGNYSLLLADDGTVFACGANTNGRTGQGTSAGITEVASQIDPAHFSNLAVVELSVGGVTALLRTSDDTVWALGNCSAGNSTCWPRSIVSGSNKPVPTTTSKGASTRSSWHSACRRRLRSCRTSATRRRQLNNSTV